MKICLFFEESIVIKKVSEEINRCTWNEGKKYFVVDPPISFELGFYNLIIHDEIIVGVNFYFNSKSEEIISFFALKKYANVKLGENEVFIFFEQEEEFWIDQGDEFINLFLFKSDSGDYALTFEVSIVSEYAISEKLIHASSIDFY